MHVSCQLIIVAIIYSCYNILAIESTKCDCDVLQVNDPNGVIGYQNFTKQNRTLNGKPFYLSMKQHMIYWNNDNHWCYDFYLHQQEFCILGIYDKDIFSLESICKNSNWTGLPQGPFLNGSLTTKCLKSSLRNNNICSATKEFLMNVTIDDDIKEVEVKTKDPCIFPFKYNNKSYTSCISKDHKRHWCATSIDSRNHYQEIWGYCNDLCPKETVLNEDEFAVKFWHLGILVGIILIILIIALIIGYI